MESHRRALCGRMVRVTECTRKSEASTGKAETMGCTETLQLHTQRTSPPPSSACYQRLACAQSEGGREEPGALQVIPPLPKEVKVCPKPAGLQTSGSRVRFKRIKNVFYIH
ncbi:hypothetical protein EYF80_064241 [Liparis tanakae]|uniref:Uncharacterized protein n=1 Tax=Liparis tanakae TaxID=230148 RepID=A0A4Z2E9Y5_9TELE|nr:hypothetical protein EYF80_064241 [Liparis tanakae]